MLLKKKNIDMTEGPILQQMAAYTIPILMGELFQQFYTMVDSIIIGRYVGRSALAAIGVSETIVRVLVGFFNGMAVGFTIAVAKDFGSKDRERLSQTVNSILQLALLLGILMTAGGLLLLKPILHLVNDVPPDTFDQAATYLSIYFCGILGFVLYNTVAGVLRAMGDVQTPLYCLFLSSVVNIVMDLILVIYFDMSVAGVAYATIFSQWMAAVISFWVLTHRDLGAQIDPRRYRLDARTAWFLLGLGVPNGLQKTITSVSNVLVLSRIAFFEEACMAGWTVYNKLDNVITVCIQSLGSSLSTFVSQNLGAKKYRRMEEGVRTTIKRGTQFFLVMASVLVLFRAPLVRIFGSDAETIYYAERFVLVITFCKLMQLLMQLYAGALRGVGKMTLVTALLLSGIVVFRQIYLAVITSVANTPWLVGLSYPAGWTFSFIWLMLIYVCKTRKEWRAQYEE